ncbi:MAG TPA: hypothetical protein VI483_00735 [Candidatus Paceibacterota bacterium]
MLGKILTGERAIGVANIESSSVSFSIVKLQSATNATIPITRYAELPIEERTSGQHLFALKQRLADITKAAINDYTSAHGGRALKKLYAVVHAPWAIGNVVSASTRFPQETYISEKIMDDCATKALAQGGKGGELLDVHQLPIMLNGYRTAHPEGKYAHLVEVAGLMSTCDANIREEIAKTFRDVLPASRTIIHSGARAIVEAIEATRPQLRDALCMHVSGEGTEVIVLRNGMVRSYTYITEGLRSIFSRAFPGMHPEEARTAVRLMQRQEGSEVVGVQTEEALLKAEPDMVHAYGEELAKISAQLRLPNAVFLIASPDIAPWLQKFFERLDFSQFTVTAQPFSVDLISASEFTSIEDGTSERNGDLDVAMATSHVLREEYGSA